MMTPSDRDLEKYGETFLQSFEAIRRALALYPGQHPKVGEQLARFVRNLNELSALVGEATFNVIHKEFFINGLPLKRLSMNYSKAIDTWDSLGLGLVRFSAATTPESALSFFEALGRNPDDLKAAGGIGALMAQSGIQGIRVTGVASELQGDSVPIFEEISLQGVEASSRDEAYGRFRGSKDELSAIVDQAWGTTSNPARMIRTVSFLVEHRLFERRVVAGLLDKLRAHHEPSWRHAVDGATVAVLMGRVLGLPRDRMSVLGEAAVLRDIGKLAIPAADLAVHDASAERSAEYRRHPETGARMLLATRELDPATVIVAFEHHARYDGRGFPRIRARKGQHPFARIVAVASDYEQLTGASAGDARILPADAMKKMTKEAGSTYDPAALRALLSLLGLYPEGTAVQLRDGRYGVVAGVGMTHWAHPDIAMLKDTQGHDIEPEIVLAGALGSGSEASITATFQPTREDAQRLEALRIA